MTLSSACYDSCSNGNNENDDDSYNDDNDFTKGKTYAMSSV